MLGQTYYHGTIRKHVIAFGTLFNDISIKNYDDNGVAQKTIKVPLSYAPKEKFFRRREEQYDDGNSSVKMTLPRMGFELTDIEYDPQRQLNKNQRIVKVNDSDNTKYKSQYMRAPYKFNFVLYAKVRYENHGLQIVEQILPYFQPDFTVALKDMNDLDIVTDVPITLQGIDHEEDYEGALNSGETRTIVWALQFQSKGYLYHPIKDNGLIRKVLIDISSNIDVDTALAEERVVVEPDPSDADADDDWDASITIKDV